jgi:prevent-host-death family protein
MSRNVRWKLEEAKARFSELVRRAEQDGPQTVTVRGREAVVVMSADQFAKLQPAAKREPLIDFLSRLDLEAIDLTRQPDVGRDVTL